LTDGLLNSAGMKTGSNSPLKKAVLLAAGKGTRMKELTAELPKPMIPVAGTPVLERIVCGMKEAGISEFLIVTGYRADVVESHFGNGGKWDVSIRYARQVVQDGTGRVVELARDFAGKDPFLLSYGDILVSSQTYAEAQRVWREKPCDGVFTVKLGEDIRKGAVAIFDADFRLCELVEKPDDAQIEALRGRFGDFKPWYNAGIYVFPPELFEYTARLQKSPRGEYELPEAIRQMVVSGKVFQGMVIEGSWVDVRDPEVLQQLNQNWRG